MPTIVSESSMIGPCRNRTDTSPLSGTNGIRTRVNSVTSCHPRPLDDGSEKVTRTDNHPLTRKELSLVERKGVEPLTS